MRNFDDAVDEEAMAEGLSIIGQIMETIVLHPLLYDPQHFDYKDEIKNGTKTLSVWNHICNVVCTKGKKRSSTSTITNTFCQPLEGSFFYSTDSRNVGFDFNAQFAECMLQRIAV